ncbi:MAG: ABC transporter permease subunit [Acidobacteria bacterium]|nr:ABC transporter permease subunit [Acidobacteriota bacterium]MCZ6753119.1 ABC transporter permease subunit [Acidobacteriota bacterium]
MRNIWTIARRELAAYFHSPIAYIVLAMFTVLFGFIFYSNLRDFMMEQFRAAQYAQMYGQSIPLNVNESVIRSLVYAIAVICLFLMPMITMRLFAEEKKTGTIELLMTSPLTDLEIILGKFLGAFLLYVSLLVLSLLYILILFLYGNPDGKALIAAYLGLVLLGGCYLSLGLMLSTLTRNQVIAGSLGFGLFFMLYLIGWASSYSTGQLGQLANYISFTTHIDNFSKGVIDLRDTVYYLSVIGLSLFLTARSVESVRWRA